MKTIYNYKTNSKQIFILLLFIANMSNNIIAMDTIDMDPAHKKQVMHGPIYERSQRRSPERDTTRKLHHWNYEYTKMIYGKKEADFLFTASHSELEDHLKELEKQDQ